MKTRPLGLLPLALILAPGCGARSGPPGGPCDQPGAVAPTCVAPAADPCGPPELVAPVCDQAARAYRCPAGAREYERARGTADPCLPFSDPS